MIPPPSSPKPPRLLDDPPEGRRASSRPLVVGLAISTALHLVLIAVYPLLAPRPSELSGPVLSADGPPRLQGTEVIRIVELPAEDEPEEPEAPEEPEPEPARPVPARPPTAPGPTAEPSAGGDAAVPSDEELMSAAERLRPRARDLRLWAPLPENLTELSDEQRMQLDLALTLAAVADSMALAAEAARRATDWTFTDSEGKRWGVSPGKIHLGDITLPMPFGFSAPYDPSADNAWQWQELERANASAAARESARERGAAIRERMDRERARQRPGPVRPDTSGVGG